MRSALLAALSVAAVLGARPARAWEAKASGVERRLKALEATFKAHDGPAAVRGKSALAAQTRKPRWTRKTHWTERFAGKDYVFGVGAATRIVNRELRLTEAEDRARRELVEVVGKKERVSGGAEASGLLKNAVALDWFHDKKTGTVYALMLILP